MGNEDISPAFDEVACNDLEIRLKKLEGKKNALARKLVGSIDAGNADYLRRSVMKVIEAGSVFLSLASGGVQSLSSTVVATFIFPQKVITEKGKKPSLDRMQPRVRTIFNLLYLETFFRGADSKNE
jgi:anti-anti-sigma factor